MQSKDGVVSHLNEEAVAQVAADYITATFGPTFSIYDLSLLHDGSWSVKIQAQHPALAQPGLVGSLRVDGASGQIIPLSAAEISDMRERILMFAAHERNELARDEQGYILPLVAKRSATGYVTSDVIFFVTVVDRPTWVEGAPPRWRVTFAVQLPRHGVVSELGTVDVNALTGEVFALSENEIATWLKRAHDAAETSTRSAATAN